MKVITVIVLLIVAVVFIFIMGALFLACLAMRCNDCPHKDKCENDKNFQCPFDYPMDPGPNAF